MANTLDDTVSRIDIGSGQVATIDIGGEPAGIATGAGFAWVADATEGTVDQIDAGANRIVGSLEVGNGPRGVAVGYGSVWVLAAIDGESRSDRPRPRRGDRPDRGWLAADRDRGRGGVAVGDRRGGRDRRPHRARLRKGLGGDRGRQRPRVGVAFGEGAVWVTNRTDGTVSRIDPETNAITSTVEVGAGPVALAAGEGAIWVANAGDGTVSRLAPDTADVEETIDVGGSPSGMTVASGAVWTSVLASPASHRGGTLTVAMPADYLYCECVDLAVYDLGLISLASVAYDGLTAYRHVDGAAGSTLVGNLATEVPEAEDDGLTYVFELRPDLRFSDGTEVDPEDFRSLDGTDARDQRRIQRAAGGAQPRVPLPGHRRGPSMQRPVAPLRSVRGHRDRS